MLSQHLLSLFYVCCVRNKYIVLDLIFFNSKLMGWEKLSNITSYVSRGVLHLNLFIQAGHDQAAVINRDHVMLYSH